MWCAIFFVELDGDDDADDEVGCVDGTELGRGLAGSSKG